MHFSVVNMTGNWKITSGAGLYTYLRGRRSTYKHPDFNFTANKDGTLLAASFNGYVSAEPTAIKRFLDLPSYSLTLSQLHPFGLKDKIIFTENFNHY